jgi:hypothetical protein
MELNYQDRRFLSSLRIASEDTRDRDLRNTLRLDLDEPGTRIREVDPPNTRSDNYLTVIIFVVGMLMAALAGFCIGMVAR